MPRVLARLCTFLACSLFRARGFGPRVAAPLLALVWAGNLSAQTLTQLREVGPRTNKINVVILAEGYTASETAKFHDDARSRLNGLLVDESWARFANLINGFAIFAASAESGADDPATSTIRDTYFDSTYGTSGIDRLLTVRRTDRVYALLNEFIPDYDVVIVLVNAAKYGGAGGGISVTSLHPSANEILLHEIGHSFALLADEYVDLAAAPNYPPRESINATQNTTRETAPWRDFIWSDTSVPTLSASDENTVGLFRGSYYREEGFYRPTFNSKMRELGRPWGPVNVRAFAAAVHRLNLNVTTAAPTIAEQPATASVADGQPHTLRVQAGGVGPLTYQWRRDGKNLSGATSDTFTIAAMRAHLAGSYSVEVSNAAGFILSANAALSLASGAPQNVITFAALPDRTYGDGELMLTASASSGLLVGYALVSGPAVVSGGNRLGINGVGEVVVRATQPGNETVPAADPVIRSFRVNPRTVAMDATPLTGATQQAGAQTVTFNGTYFRAAFATTPNVPYSISYDGRLAPADPSPEVAWSTFPWRPGEYSIRGEVVGPNYIGAQTQTLRIVPAPVSISLSNLTQTAGATRPVAVATAPAQVVTFSGTPQNSQLAPPIVRVTYNGATAVPTLAGNYEVIATVTNEGYVGTATARLVVSALVQTQPQAQTIAFGAMPPRTYGDTPFSVQTTASSGLPVAVTVASGPATIAGNTLTLTGAGMVTLQATQAGNASFAPASTMHTFTVARAPAQVNFGTLTFVADGGAKAAAVTTQPAGLSVDVRYDGSANVPSVAGTYAVVATITDPNYAGTARATLTILPLTPTGGGSVAGAYFGEVSAPVPTEFADGAANPPPIEPTRFALLVRPNRTGVFLGYAANQERGYLARFTLAQDDSFEAVAESTQSSLVGVSETAVLRGRIVDGELRVSLSGVMNDVTIRAARLPEGGRDGVFVAEALGTESGRLHLVFGGEGRLFALAAIGSVTAAALGDGQASGSFAVVLPQGRVEGTIDAGTGVVAATLSREGGSVRFAGLAEALPRTDRFVNISTRAMAGSAAEALIGGFVIRGSTAKQVLVRAVGPALADFGVSDALSTVRLALYQGDRVLAENAGWSSAANAPAIAAAAAGAGAFAFRPGSGDAALLVTLPPGAYTAMAATADGKPGTALVEIYDVSAADETERLLNLSTRGNVRGTAQPLIAGVVVRGNVPKRMLVRAVGPALRSFGVTDVLSAPRLVLYENSRVIAENAGWSDDAGVSAVSSRVGAFQFSAGSADAALVITLNPGAYSAVVTGSDGASGVVLLEVYEAP